MAFTTNLSGTTQLDDSIVLAFDQSYLIAVGQNNVMDQFVTYKADIGAKSIQFPKYSRLAVATTPLVEADDVTSEAMADAPILITPAEYGNVITTTSLSSLQTGGKADLAAAQLVGINHAQTLDKLAILALDACTNVLTVGGDIQANITAGNVVSLTFLNSMYNKLARASVPMVNGAYVAVMHDDVIADLRADVSVGSWTDVTKYATPETALRNEVGMYKGFRVVRDNQATITVDGGAGAVDNYNSYYFGMNALGKATSQTGRMTATGPFDKLGRFVNLGWYEVSGYKIVDMDCVWKGVSASSLGVNV